MIFQINPFTRNCLFTLVIIYFLAGCKSQEKDLTIEEYLQTHVEWLASDERGGRLAGSIHEADAANYISDRFLRYGLLPMVERLRYIQLFELTGPIPQLLGVDNHVSRNVIGAVPGSEYPDRFIIIGAHYDGQGMGGLISMDSGNEPQIHNSADDNASGTAGLLWLAKHFASNPAQNTIIFAAFSGEELGLLGSRWFVANLEMPKDSVLAMINLDMIGRLDDGKLDIFGTGTANIWDSLLDEIQADSLTITRTPGGMGSSDHAAFYEAGIPALHYHTGTHDDYHRSSDTAEKINYTGIRWVLAHVEKTVMMVDSFSPDEIEFRESTDPRPAAMRRDGIGLGVVPDYRFSGTGLRIDSVRSGNSGDRAGMKDGDIVIKIGERYIADIYEYMNFMNGVEPGDKYPVVVLRGDEELELTVIF
ncbi:MAG: M28 family peptidase [Balneolaceae bacterium]|nr:MAG: M28 family peptidase [Balneolaceae bacterium]